MLQCASSDAQIEVVAPKSRQDFAPRTESARLDLQVGARIAHICLESQCCSRALTSSGLQTQTQSLEENLPSTAAPATGPVVEAERPMQPEAVPAPAPQAVAPAATAPAATEPAQAKGKGEGKGKSKPAPPPPPPASPVAAAPAPTSPPPPLPPPTVIVPPAPATTTGADTGGGKGKVDAGKGKVAGKGKGKGKGKAAPPPPPPPPAATPPPPPPTVASSKAKTSAGGGGGGGKHMRHGHYAAALSATPISQVVVFFEAECGEALQIIPRGTCPGGGGDAQPMDLLQQIQVRSALFVRAFFDMCAEFFDMCDWLCPTTLKWHAVGAAWEVAQKVLVGISSSR